ncbi:class I SAM-dependent methyltransferase [Natronomonas marina]|jgi:SAM-dependent methyltransferase|uniref:class I SAM-dependent methyltransferase n=1 Tax=Natronomonas marina TaxID=2961939 RepID=UPI0020C9F63A|nr:class I SAM-dependent methyltransferase [Natronomonas marina]
MTTWNERFRQGDYPRDPEPSALLKRYVETFPEGRAMDVAAGTGRNAVFLAESGYEVDAVDRSRAGLEIAVENAEARGVADRLHPVRADLTEYAFPTDAYDVVTISFYRAVDRLPDIKASLKPGGMLFVEHHLRTTDDVQSGPSGDRYRFAANELLAVCLDTTVLHYEAGRERRGRSAGDRETGEASEADQREASEEASGEQGRPARGETDGRVGAVARIVARNSTGQRQSYPFVPDPGDA